MSEPQQSLTTRAWLLLGLLALVWGASFLSNRAALAEVGVLTTVAFRVAGAAVFLWAYVVVKGLPVPAGIRAKLAFFVQGILNNVIPFTLIVWGQQHIDSGLASILNGATAIFAVLLVPFFFRDERLTLRKSIGVALGFAGVTVTIGISALADLDLTSLGQLAVLGAAVSYAFASIFARAALRGIRPEVSAAGMLTGASIVMLPWALMAEGVPTLQYAATTWAALAYLAFAASALAYILYYKVLALAGAGNLSLVTLLIPPIAIVLGTLVYQETLPVSAYLGLALIAAGMIVIDGRFEKFIHKPSGAKDFS
ncbi:MAG: DMT family transporter [Rhodobacteraceae bacterium]|nr:DMT family transporter [Paracoccaceae bacterium]